MSPGAQKSAVFPLEAEGDHFQILSSSIGSLTPASRLV